jgi:hypothetical protein
MKVAIMQPYFFPYIGYFQLLQAVDVFVIYDNIQFSKKGWINRNRILANGKDEYFTLPLKKDSDYLNVVDRKLSDNFEKDKVKTLRKIKECYRKAPFFDKVFPLIENAFNYQSENLFDFILHSLKLQLDFLEISTEVVISSSLEVDHTLKSQDKVIAICESLKASAYYNPIGGLELYDNESFESKNMKLSFMKSNPIEYPQLGKAFVPWLSMIDVMMFNDKDTIKRYLEDFSFVEK